jgi:hypothetical protein
MNKALPLLIMLALGVSACLEMPTPNAPNASTETPNALGVTKTATQPALLTSTARAATVTAWTLVVHVEPDVKSTVTGWLLQGDVVTVTECKDNWCNVRTSELTGWTFRGCLSDNPAGLGCQQAR